MTTLHKPTYSSRYFSPAVKSRLSSCVRGVNSFSRAFFARSSGGAVPRGAWEAAGGGVGEGGGEGGGGGGHVGGSQAQVGALDEGHRVAAVGLQPRLDAGDVHGHLRVGGQRQHVLRPDHAGVADEVARLVAAVGGQ